MTVKEMHIKTTQDVLGNHPRKEEIHLTIDVSDTNWQETHLGRIRTGSLIVSENGQHVKLPIEYEPKILGEPGMNVRVRNIQLAPDGRGMDPLKSNRDFEDRTLYVHTYLNIREVRNPEPKALRPEEV